jgi:hypothetical protein
MLDDLDSGINSGGFSDGLYKGIVALIILNVNPQRPLHAVLLESNLVI